MVSMITCVINPKKLQILNINNANHSRELQTGLLSMLYYRFKLQLSLKKTSKFRH